MKKALAWNAAIALSALSLPAFAQDPAGITTADQATSGQTNVAAGGFQQAEKAPEAAADLTTLSVGAGGALSLGNANSMMYTVAGDFALRRGMNQLKAKAAFNGAKASGSRDPETQELPAWENTVGNYQGLVRYDRFFSKVISGFLQVSLLRDTFQGLDARLTIDPGVAIYVIDEADQQWGFDVGYDFMYENYFDDANGTLTLHNLRLATAYVNNVNAAVTFKIGAEYLLAMSPYDQEYCETDQRKGIRLDDGQSCADAELLPNETALSDVTRVNWSTLAYAKLDAKVSDSFTVQTALSLRHDNSPVELSYATDDLQTSVNLIYTMF
jgi:hypothetical protein